MSAFVTNIGHSKECQLLLAMNMLIEKFEASWFRRPKRTAIVGTLISQRPDQPKCPPSETPVYKQNPHIINAF